MVMTKILKYSPFYIINNNLLYGVSNMKMKQKKLNHRLREQFYTNDCGIGLIAALVGIMLYRQLYSRITKGSGI